MNTLALTRKWRAQTFDGILGQEHITRTLQRQIKAGRVGHAYLFSGVRGTGKTSTARILARAINCVGNTADPPCNQCEVCRTMAAGASLDLIEIDAASNRGIDEIRELRERVGFMPQQGRYRVYVIDEVHMLTNEAFNALLKTLEEPPAHVIFVLCTTEAHRLPDTILSRCQRFEFRRAAQHVVAQKLRYICDQEGLHVSDEALAYLARRGAGSFRDAESLLDQVAAYGAGDVSLELAQSVLGAVPYQLVLAVSRALTIGDVAGGLRAVAEAFDSGADARQLLGSIIEQLRALLLMRVGTSDEGLLVSQEEALELRSLIAIPAFSLRRLVQGIRLFSEASEALRTAARPEIPLELALVEAIAIDGGELAPGSPAPSAGVAPSSTSVHSETPTPQPAAVEPTSARAAGTGQPDARPVAEREREAAEEQLDVPESSSRNAAALDHESGTAPSEQAPRTAAAKRTLSLDVVQGNWSRVVARMRAQNPQLQAVLRSVYPTGVTGDLVTLACESAFHRDRLSDDRRREQVEQELSDVLGTGCRVQCVVDRDARARQQGSEGGGGKGLFAESDAQEAQRQQLLNHPAVRDLTERGGRVRRVELDADQDS